MAKLTTSQRNALSSSQFVFPKTRKYPIQDKGHAQHAIRIGSIQLGKGNLSVAQYNQIVKAVNQRYGFNAKLKTSSKKKVPMKPTARASIIKARK